jgi:AmmeMemoRadiSam system protein B
LGIKGWQNDSFNASIYLGELNSTPLGDLPIDTEMADNILCETSIVDVDELSHRFEHSIEVQLPFLQYLYGNSFKIVPICFLMQDFDSAIEVGRALVEALDSSNSVIIASSDMTHYESAKVASVKDQEALKAVINLDAKKFYKTVESKNISACGYAPITALIAYANGANIKKAELLSYHNSGEITRDNSSVVGYAAVIFKK